MRWLLLSLQSNRLLFHGGLRAEGAERLLKGQKILLSPKDNWVVQGATHTYRILEAFTAVEATRPPA